MKFIWDKSKKGYLLYRASSKKIPTYINEFPIVGFYNDAFLFAWEKDDLIVKMFLKLLEREKIEHGEVYADEVDANDWYNIKLLDDRIDIDVKFTYEWISPSDNYHTYEINLSYDNHTFNIENNTNLNIEGREDLIWISRELAYLIHYLYQINNRTDCLVNEIKNCINSSADISLFSKYIEYINSREYFIVDEYDFIRIEKAYPSWSEIIPIYFDTTQIEKASLCNNLVTNQEHFVINHSKKNINISKIYKDINVYGLELNFIDIGKYPQSKVTDRALENALNKIKTVNENKFIFYDGNEYINTNKEYEFEPPRYFRVEPIQFRVLSETGENVFLISEKIIDKHIGQHFSENKFYCELFLSHETYGLILDFEEYFIYGKIDHSEQGRKTLQTKIDIFEKMKQKIYDDYRRISERDVNYYSSKLMWVLFRYIEPIVKELEKILVIDLDCKEDQPYFLYNFPLKELYEFIVKNSNNIKVYEGNWLRPNIGTLEIEKLLRKADCTDFAKENSNVVTYHPATLNKSDYAMSCFGNQPFYKLKTFWESTGFRPILKLRKQLIGKNITLDTNEKDWEFFLNES